MGIRPDRPVLVGRDREQQFLRALLDRSCAGRGCLALVSGEAGIGKTTLVEYLLHEAHDRGCLILSGGCYDLTTTPPYGPWTEAMRGYRPAEGLPSIPSWFGILDEVEKLGSQTAIFEEARRFFASIAGQQPLVIVLEDLHWSDPASVDALRYLSRTLRDTPILILATYRDDEPYPNEPLLTALSPLVRESRAERLELRRWPVTSTRALISGRYRLATEDEARLTAHIHRQAEGNPFYSVELLRVLEGDATLRPQAGGWAVDELTATQVPPLVRQVIEHRLDRLLDQTQALLEFASVIGHDVPFDLWRDVSATGEGQLAAAVNEAVRAQLIDELPDRSGVRFRHTLVRETFYAQNNSLLLRGRHRRAGEQLALQSSPDPDAVAHHFQRAGDARALGWLLRAGLRARRTAAWFTAIERFMQAATMLEGDLQRTAARGWLIYYAGFLARYTNDDRLIESYFSEAAELAVISDDRQLLASVRWQRGVLRCHRGVIGDGLEDMEAAKATLEQLSPDRSIPLVDDRIVAFVEQLTSSPVRDMQRVSEPMTQNCFASQRLDIRWGAIAHWLAHAGRFERAISLGTLVVATIQQADQEGVTLSTAFGSAYYGVAISNSLLGNPDTARDAFEAGRARAVLEGDSWAASLAALFELCLLALPYEADQPSRRTQLSDAAAEILSGASALSSGTGGLNFCTIVLDYIDGRWVDAELNARPLINQPHLVVFLGTLLAPILARILRDQGRSTDAWTLLRDTLPDGANTEPGSGPFLAAQAMQRLAVDLTLDASDLPAARDWLEVYDRWQEWSGAVLGQADGHLLWARYYLVAEDRRQAREWAESALACASDPRQPLALIAAHRFLGELDTQERKYEAAGVHLTTAAELAEACQAPYEIALTRLAQAELARAMGDVLRATDFLARARETLERLGAAPALERADRIAAGLTGQVHQFPAGLTPREVEVLCLVAAGLSNREIADRLYLSVRTVESHIGNIYGKIDVTNRVEAAAFVQDQQLTTPDG